MNIVCIPVIVHHVKRIWPVIKRPIKHIIKTKTFKVTCFVIPGAIGTWEAKNYLGGGNNDQSGTSSLSNTPNTFYPPISSSALGLSGSSLDLLDEAIKDVGQISNSPQFLNTDFHNTNIIVDRSPELNTDVPEPSTILIFGTVLVILWIVMLFKSVLRRF